MSSYLYGFGASTSAAKAATALSNYATGRSLTVSDPSSQYSVTDFRRPSSMFYSTSDVLSAYSSAATGGSSVDHVGTGIKRPYEALYHPTLLGAHSMFGQSEAWYSANSLAKRSRLDNAISLPVYPQRPGEKDCVYYMQTRTCKFGDSCRFDHPIWVPEGGIPDWKEVPLVDTSTSLPERPGAPDCPYFLKTQKCKFGMKCKFSHPKDKLTAVDSLENVDISALPERPSEPLCAFYLKTGKCKFGSSCKFHHPKDIQVRSAGQENGTVEHMDAAVKIAGTTGNAKPFVPSTPAFLFNSKELPIRLGEPDCPFYLKTGSCKYGASCRYSHPERTAAAISHPILATQAANLNLGVLNPIGSMYQTIDPRLTQSLVRVGPTVYPQRPGEIECDYYMKTGECKFGERCRFHHPIDRSAREMSAAKQAQEQTVELTLAGLPRREGSIHCPYYMKTGTCMYGVNCKFDHPPPGEVMANTASQGTTLASSVG